KETFHDSKVVSLVFDSKGVKEKNRNSALDAFFYDVLSRLRHMTGKAIEFSELAEDILIKGEVRRENSGSLTHSICPFEVNPVFDGTVSGFINGAVTKLAYKEEMASGTSLDEATKDDLAFRVRALLHGILDRGM
ncbi:hypothetical protein PMAYCL1PPCAC_21158, partial [Pristionchus mayeri]